MFLTLMFSPVMNLKSLRVPILRGDWYLNEDIVKSDTTC